MANETNEHGSGLIVLFIAVSQILGSVINEVLLRLKIPIPYSVVLLIIGMTLQYIEISQDNHLGASIAEAASINPHMVFLIFLPVLLFESAFSINYHIMFRSINQAFLLAGPGVIISTLLTASLTKWLLSVYNWDWSVCLMFGAILSATDPVAVVALLREVGASKQLAALIEGESLFNDGTAYVFYLVFVDLVHGAAFNIGESSSLFFRLALGGPLLGIIIGILTAYWLSYCYNNKAAEITTTIFVAYLAFYLGENTTIHVSGVLAVVCLGIYMSRSHAVISVNVHAAMHSVWHQISYMANTYIFLLAGILIIKIFQTEGAIDIIGSKDFGYLIVVYIIIHIVRLIVVSLLAPFLTKLGYGMSLRDGVVLVWGALRGAVGLVLALLVLQDDEINLQIRVRMAFLVAGIVFMTLLINGTTISLILNALGMSVPFKSQIVLLKAAMNHLSNETTLALESIQQDPFYSGADWNYISKTIPKLEQIVTDRIAHEDQDNQRKLKLLDKIANENKKREEERAIEEAENLSKNINVYHLHRLETQLREARNIAEREDTFIDIIEEEGEDKSKRRKKS